MIRSIYRTDKKYYVQVWITIGPKSGWATVSKALTMHRAKVVYKSKAGIRRIITAAQAEVKT